MAGFTNKVALCVCVCVDEIEEEKGFRLIYNMWGVVCVCVCVNSGRGMRVGHSVLEKEVAGLTRRVALCVCVCVCVCVCMC